MNKSVEFLPRALNFRNQYNKISWQSSNPYNKRWQFKFKHAYYSYPRDLNQDHSFIKKPEDSWEAVPLGWAWFQDIYHRHLPGWACVWDRRHRLFDKLNVYVLPGFSLFFSQFYELGTPFKILTLLPWAVIYTRVRDRSGDPDFKETYLRDMLYKNPEITQYFSEETLHILDYDCEYDRGFPDPEKFPEFNNRIFRFFNTDTHMTTGFFKIGDVETGAVMNLKFKTMPIPGKYRYQVGEPFYFYDLRGFSLYLNNSHLAEITHNGVLKEVVVVDEKESLQKVRPFLFLI